MKIKVQFPFFWKKLIFMVLWMHCFLSFAQETKEIKGKVTDETGESLPGVNVLVQGTSTGAITDLEGNYSISMPQESKPANFWKCHGFKRQVN